MPLDIEDLVKTYSREDNIDYDKDVLLELLDYLVQWIDDVIKKSDDTITQNQIFNNLKPIITKKIQSFLKPHKIQIKKAVLLYYYRKFISEKLIEDNYLLSLLLIRKPANDN